MQSNAPLRSDAVRSRARIIDAARGEDPDDLRFNRIARIAGVGVGTVYRHFPHPHALKEALTVDTLAAMVDVSRKATAETDAATSLRRFIGSALTLQLENGGLQAVLLSQTDESEEVSAMKQEILESFTAVLEKARSEGLIRADVTVERLEHLVCGIEYAVRLGSREDRELFLDVLLAGLRPQGENRTA